LAFTPGTRLGVYEVTTQVGAGGPAYARVNYVRATARLAVAEATR
jgi:hypothetical protein